MERQRRGRLKRHVWSREQFGYGKKESKELIRKDGKKKHETVATFHNVSQWLQEDYGVCHPTSSTGCSSKLADTLGTNESLPAGCISAWGNIFQGVCPGTSNTISPTFYTAASSVSLSGLCLSHIQHPPKHHHLHFKHPVSETWI